MDQGKIVIIDYGMGNLGSIQNMLKKIGAKSIISDDPLEIKGADKLILPGVGAFDSGMRNLKQLGLIPLLEEKVLEQQTPMLGICLGMQLFSKRSDEGSQDGLGWFDAQAVHFKFEMTSLRVPHMGWNSIEVRKEHPVLKGLYQDARFYFVHSYYLVCNVSENVLATTQYGYPFASIIQHQNIIGVQFHPEKSHKFGMQLLKNFVEFK